MPEISLSRVEMADFPLEVRWSGGAVGRVVAVDGVLWLESDQGWSILQAPGRTQPPIEIRAESDRGPVFLTGVPSRRGGNTHLRLRDVRVGSSDPDVPLETVWAAFDYASEVVRYHPWDGAGRLLSEPMNLPALAEAPTMSLTFESGSIEMHCSGGASIEAFETQLDAFQRLVTFAAQRAASRQSLRVRDVHGGEMTLYRRTAVPLREVRSVDYRDFPLRLGNASSQTAINRWWEAMSKLRPIPQLLAALRYQKGYLEGDFLFLATAIDRLSEAWTSAPGPLSDEQVAGMNEAAVQLGIPDFSFDNRPYFATRSAALADTLDQEVWLSLQIDRASWLASVRRHRNLVAHADEQRTAHKQFLLGDGLRALLAATDAVVTLTVAQHLGVEQSTLVRAASRQYVKRISTYAAGDLVFTNSGIEDRRRPVA